MASSLLSLWQSSRISEPTNPAMLAAAQSGKCATNIDAICVAQITPCQAATVAGAGHSGSCPPKATVFASTNVPYQVGGIGVLPLNQFQYLPGIN